jgi:two-component system sensor histidine kinase PilS (NtrC family)
MNGEAAAFQRKVQTHLVLRLLAAVFILAVTFLFQLRLAHDISEPVLTPLYVYAAVLFSVTLLSASVLRIMRRHELFAAAQFIFDVLAVTFLIYLTGGVASPFAFLYMAVIIAAAVLFQRRGSVLAAAACTIAYGALLDLQYFGWVHPVPFMGRPVPSGSNSLYFYTLTVTTAAFFLVASISGYLAAELQKSSRLSAQKTRDLRLLESFYRRLVESLGAGLITADAHGKITYANQAARKLLGAEGEILEGCPVAHWLSGLQENPAELEPEKKLPAVSVEGVVPRTPETVPREGPGAKDSVDDRLITGPAVQEIPYETPGGEKKSFVVTVSQLEPLSDGLEGPVSVVVFQDQTLLKALQDRMKRLEQLAFAGKMAGEIVHDIKNPLAAISGVVQMMEAQWEGDDVSRRLRDILVREIDRLNVLVGRFLWIAREGKGKDRAEPVKVSETVRQVLDALTMSKLLTAHHRVHTDVPEKLTVSLVPPHLFQILWHLVANAAEASPQGAVIHIAARHQRLDDGRFGTVLTVSDNGPGIPEKLSQKIFDPLFTTKEGHLGLGLSVVCRLVEEAGGQISVGSSAVFPTCVRLFFPEA